MTAPGTPDQVFRARRRAALSRHAQQIGLDYVEVRGPAQLRLHFVPAATGVSKATVRPTALTPANVRLVGATGLEQTHLRVAAVEPLPSEPAQAVDLTLHTEANGGGEAEMGYTLTLVDVPYLDPFFTQAAFALEPLDQPRQSDPAAAPVDAAPVLPTPEIDYLARDFSGFRRLLLHRLSTLMPAWQEQHPADLGHTLVDILAYAADQVSYYQDAVATEAYLGTARRRVSVKRHARLIDYTMHEGCNARVWVHVQARGEAALPAGTRLLARTDGLRQAVVCTATATPLVAQGASVFETMHPLQLVPEHNELQVYTWGMREVTLPTGTTSATLVGHVSGLQPGTVLLFEVQRGAATGGSWEAHPEHRHVVRLTDVALTWDALGDPGSDHQAASEQGLPITTIAWHVADALPFPLPVAAPYTSAPLSVVRGNLVLADHGRTLETPEALPAPSAAWPYRPRLQRLGLTFSMPYHHDIAVGRPASTALAQDPRRAVAAIRRLTSTDATGREEAWLVQRDLLDSDRFTRACVVEMESDGQAQLRFGDGTHGAQPAAGQRFQVTYRVGNGPQGNLGRDVLAHVVTNDLLLTQAIASVRNPLAAHGGTAPEPLEQVRLYAPRALHAQERCVTEADYVAIAERHPEVRKAAALLRWTGSWYTALVVVDRTGGRPVDAAFREALLAGFAPYRLTGYDLAIREPFAVALDLALTVHVAPTHVASAVKQALLEAFSTVTLPNGRRGFFHPDAWTMGQPVYLSHIIAQAMQVPGVVQVEATRLQRLGQPSPEALQDGRLPLGPLEVVRVHAGSPTPQASRMALTMQGGR